MATKKASSPVVLPPLRITFSYKDSLVIANYLDRIAESTAGSELRIRMWNFIATRFPEVRGSSWSINQDADQVFLEKETK